MRPIPKKTREELGEDKFMKKQVRCKICSKYFEVSGTKSNGFFKPLSIPWNIKTCSESCRKENGLQTARKQSARNKLKVVKSKCRFCKKEIISSEYCTRNFCGGKASDCYKQWLSKHRKGKDNPAYRNGLRSSGKSPYTGIHLRACAKYRKSYLETHDYLECEVCGVNGNGTPKFEVHHIYFASLYPKHKELHNFKNLILVCIQCHNSFHSSRYRSKFLELEKERGLKELFK